MAERVYQFHVVPRRTGDTNPVTGARVSCNGRVVASVSRRRKTKRSKWEVYVSSFDGFFLMTPEEYLAHHTAIAQMARHPWGDE
jgi:hypothetical protein